MTGRITSISDVLEAFVPPFEPDDGDWDAIIRSATAHKPVSLGAASPSPRRRWTRRRSLIALAVVVVLATLAVTPAFGIQGLILGLIDRTNVPFTGPTAPLEIKRNFFDLGLQMPPSYAPDVIASESRRVASFKTGGATHVLWVAPTRHGGFCWTFSPGLTGCESNRTGQTFAGGGVSPRGGPAPLLDLSFSEPMKSTVQHVTEISGDVLAPTAYSVIVRYADGTQMAVPFYFVSKPIDAGFFLADIPADHDTAQTRAIAVDVRDKAGRLLASHTFGYQTPAQQAKNLARAKAARQAFLKNHKKHPFAPPVPPKLPAPTAPLQRGQADGVTVTAGHNGIVVFDTSHATPAVRKLIANMASYGCIAPLPYYPDPVDLDQGWRTLPKMGIRIRGLHAPYLGCDIGGSYGNTWPNKLRGHKPVEIPFSPAGARYFSDRAAARDLALFVRSKAMHAIRKLTGNKLEQAIASHYGSRVSKLKSAEAARPAGRVGYASNGDVSTFVERSTTGRRFYVRTVNGKIKKQNLEDLAFVF